MEQKEDNMSSIYTAPQFFTGTLIIKEVQLTVRKGTFKKFLLADKDTDTGDVKFTQLKWKQIQDSEIRPILEANDRKDIKIHGNIKSVTDEDSGYVNDTIWIKEVELI